jgi:hypothetical protein
MISDCKDLNRAVNPSKLLKLNQPVRCCVNFSQCSGEDVSRMLFIFVSTFLCYLQPCLFLIYHIHRTQLKVQQEL